MKKIIFREIFSFFIWIGIPSILVGAGYYAQDAHKRSFAKTWEQQSSTADGGKYVARHSYIGRDYIVLRIYRAADNQLLAERTYHHPLPFWLIWSKGQVIYSTNDSSLFYDGGIALPPTQTDNILSMFP